MDLEKIKEYGNLELLSRQLVEGFITGLHKSPYHGFSVEFAEHQLYNNGESTKYIDWKVFAKTDRLYTKRFEEETNLRCMILLDRSSSMYYPSDTHAKFRFSVTADGALAYMLHKKRDAVGLCTFSDQIEEMTQVKSTGAHIHQLFVSLQQRMNEPAQLKRTSVAQVIHEVAERIHRRSLIIIFSDMMENVQQQEELFSALQHLKHNNHEVLLFHVYDRKTEVDFNFPERPTVFVDVETGEEAKAQPSQIRKYYQEQIKAQFQELKVKAGNYKIDFIEVDSGQELDQILVPYLIKRKRMR